MPARCEVRKSAKKCVVIHHITPLTGTTVQVRTGTWYLVLVPVLTSYLVACANYTVSLNGDDGQWPSTSTVPGYQVPCTIYVLRTGAGRIDAAIDSDVQVMSGNPYLDP